MPDEIEDNEETVPDEDLEVKDGDDLVALCFDCLSTIPERMAARDRFAMSGQSGICPVCKGPMRIVPKSSVESLRARRKAGGMINP